MRSTILATCVCEDEGVHTKAPDFSRLAPLYRWMEWFTFGPFLQRCRCAFLNLLRQHRAALILGDGDGRFSARLLRENERITIDAVDASPAMLNELANRTAFSNRLQTHIADARVFKPAMHDYDLVVTHFFLDCLTSEEVEILAMRLRSHVSEDATWVVSEFAIPSGWYGRAVARSLVNVLYRAFGWFTGLGIRHLPDHRAALSRAGWLLDREQRWLGSLLVSELWRTSPRP